MQVTHPPRFTKRYDLVTDAKAQGATYTPKILADFVAQQIVSVAALGSKQTLRILDPAIGHGELLISLLEALPGSTDTAIEVYGFETEHAALEVAKARIAEAFPGVSIHFAHESFLDFVTAQNGLFQSKLPSNFDLIVANPPYVRTQIMGANQAQALAQQFGLTGRVDLYHAFLLGMASVLAPDGTAGVIVSNRFMSTKSGASVREGLHAGFHISKAWDLGDTKLFDAAVLPAVLLLEGTSAKSDQKTIFTSIYQTKSEAAHEASDAIAALANEGIVALEDGRRFEVQHGLLDQGGSTDGVWRNASASSEAWLERVRVNSWGTFRDIGKIRVGVKTCADKTFIRTDWHEMKEEERPELVKPLTTHHIARRFKASERDAPYGVLYPHEMKDGRRRTCDLTEYPKSAAYLEEHRADLEGRKYVIEAGRIWYEIWVPQSPDAWEKPKLVFRDIAKQPTFWIDLDGSVVNGDCYWLVAESDEKTDLLWLACAVANSTFIEKFYDLQFNNKLYAGRRRFITQYVEKFPLPDPESENAQTIIALAKDIYECLPADDANAKMLKLNTLIWDVFGLEEAAAQSSKKSAGNGI
ncbi:Eco57I restriction-modification methylase domain-containing protein [Yoonia sp. R2-816]|uniref:Eco57I restriction-modification methylase domain-containing protein n=1 Tax=Yoonia sp. R2-816 TaxID=3342638 RepID=UPI00372C04A8